VALIKQQGPNNNVNSGSTKNSSGPSGSLLQEKSENQQKPRLLSDSDIEVTNKNYNNTNGDNNVDNSCLAASNFPYHVFGHVSSALLPIKLLKARIEKFKTAKAVEMATAAAEEAERAAENGGQVGNTDIFNGVCK
jgi:hypothetical protein